MGSLGPRGSGTKLLSRERVCYSEAQTRAGRSEARAAGHPDVRVSGRSQPAGLTAVRSELQESGFKFQGLWSRLVT